MSEIINLAEARTDISGDCRDWTVLDALKAAVRDIENGEMLLPTMVYIALKVPTEYVGKVQYTSYQAGGTTIELLGLVAKHQHILARADYD